jgi:hypothetical protein
MAHADDTVAATRNSSAALVQLTASVNIQSLALLDTSGGLFDFSGERESVPIIQCLDCGRDISDAAPACLGCGRPILPISNALRATPPLGDTHTRSLEPKKRWNAWWLALIVPATLFGACVGLAAIGAAEAKKTQVVATDTRCLEHPYDPGCGADKSHLVPSETLTMSKYDRIQVGMSYMDVATLIGRDGAQMSYTELGGLQTKLYIWKATNCCGNLTGVFQNGALTVKSQTGLE